MTDPSSSQPSENALAVEDHTLLLERARQGDTAALKEFLDLELISYKVRVIEIEVRQARLQLSLSGIEVPAQSIFEPLLQKWIVPLALPHVLTVELYGQRDGSDLPFWRSSFNPSEIDLNHLHSFIEPEVAPPAVFIDPLQVEFKASTLSGLTEVSFPEALIEAQSIPVPLTAFALGITRDDDSADENGAVPEKDIESFTTPEQSLLPEISEERAKAVKDFLARYAAGERDFAKINLNETNLSGVNLTLANLQASELIWTNLEKANLYHINLSSAKLRHANLSGAMLRSSNLQGTDFLNANLRGADLSWSNLNGANLTGADLTDANLKNAILERVILPDGTLLD
jgi:Pentapeptide repeats (8 copies)